MTKEYGKENDIDPKFIHPICYYQLEDRCIRTHTYHQSITEDNLEAFDQRCNKMVADDWVMVGNPTQSMVKASDGGFSSTYYCQFKKVY